MPKILLQDTTDHHFVTFEYNRGAAAILLSTIEIIRKLIPDTEFVSLIQLSASFSANHNIKVIKTKFFSARQFSLIESVKSWALFLRCGLWTIFHKYFHLELDILLNNTILKEYYESDVILDLSMDHYNDVHGLIKVIEISRDLMLGRMMGKPVVIYAQSPGPFKSWLASRIARIALNRVSLITVREDISKGILDKMGVYRPPIYLTADPAFLLLPEPGPRIAEILSALRTDDLQPLVGIGTPDGLHFGETTTVRGYMNILRGAYHLIEYFLPEQLFLWIMSRTKGSGYYSNVVTQLSSNFEVSIARLADHIVKTTGACVLLVPHFVPPGGSFEGNADGRVVTNMIHSLASNKDSIIPVNGEYTTQEIKGIIGKCDLFISMKMHPAIAAISQCVPTVAMGAHQKFRGIMQMMGQERWAYDRFSEDLIAIIDDAWLHREEIRKELYARQDAIREAALYNALLVKHILDSSAEKHD